MEVWRDIKDYEKKYMVSSQGNVKSLNYNNTGKERLLKQKINKYGFCEVKLSKDNKTKDFMVARLVAEAFLPNPANKPYVMHISKNGQDNSVENLRWCYISEVKFNTYKKGSRKGIYSGNKISYDGKSYKNYSDMARDKNIKPKLLHKRLDAGWDLDSALNIPLERKRKKLKIQLYKYEDKLMSIEQLSKVNGINPKLIYKRLSNDWSIEEAVEIPVAKKRRNVNAKS